MSETAQDVEARIPEGQESEESAAAAETEVRAEELTQGIADPVSASMFSEEVVEELRKPLDPNRVRRRSGRGGSQYEYLAGHDVKRRANEIFGFGNWGHEIKSRELLEAVQVTNNNREGWHVGYATVVQIWIRKGEYGGYMTEGVGYGDGVEYGPAARVQACELAIKESETDALKRAFTDLGDQFGLILYAADDEKKRIQRDANQATGRPAVEKTIEPEVPKSWPEINAAVEELDPDRQLGLADFWIPQAFEAQFHRTSARDMTPVDRTQAGQKLSGTVVALAPLAAAFPPPSRKEIADVFSQYFGGAVLEGPPWRLGPGEDERPTYKEYEEETTNVGEQQDESPA